MKRMLVYIFCAALTGMTLACGSDAPEIPAGDDTTGQAQAPGAGSTPATPAATADHESTTEAPASAIPSASAESAPAASDPSSDREDENASGALPKGNNGLGNGADPLPRGTPPENDGVDTAPGNPGNRDGH